MHYRSDRIAMKTSVSCCSLTLMFAGFEQLCSLEEGSPVTQLAVLSRGFEFSAELSTRMISFAIFVAKSLSESFGYAVDRPPATRY